MNEFLKNYLEDILEAYFERYGENGVNRFLEALGAKIIFERYGKSEVENALLEFDEKKGFEDSVELVSELEKIISEVENG